MPASDQGMRRAAIDELTIAYERTGAGPALVLLHGFLLDSRMWRPQLDTLADHFTVLAWDAPGAGQSSDPPESFGIGDWAHCLARFLEQDGIREAHILGLSWGGCLAQEFYRHYPDRARSLVLADTYAGWKGSLPDQTVQERLAALGARCLTAGPRVGLSVPAGDVQHLGCAGRPRRGGPHHG